MKTKIQTSVTYGQSKEIGIYALASVVNALAAEGGTAPVVQIRILIPEYAYKSRMHTMEKIMRKVCEEQGVKIQDIVSERSNVISQSMVIVTGYCACENEEKIEFSGKDVILLKKIGIEGMLRILEERESELKQRFSTSFLKQIKSYKKHVFSQEEIMFAREKGALSLLQVGEGGIFAALWNLAKETECGLEIDLKKISVLQETVEVCEFFKLNPYQLASAGTMLIVAKDGEKLVEVLSEQGKDAVLIGKLTDNNDKILKNGEEIRYIDRPAPDEIMKIFE